MSVLFCFGELDAAACAAERFGAKGSTLHALAREGYRIPPGFVLAPEQVEQLAGGVELGLEQILARLGQCEVAVRASPLHALPGALLTELRVSTAGGALAVRASIERVFASRQAPAVAHHLAVAGVEPSNRPWLAVIVQQMRHASGPDDFGAVASSHDPNSGEPGLCGEHSRGQGAETVVSGKIKPRPIATRSASKLARHEALEVWDPAATEALRELVSALARRFDRPVEIEVVRDAEGLWLLEARPVVLSARAQVRCALDALRAGQAAARALARLQQGAVTSLVRAEAPTPAMLEGREPLLRGLAASPGAVCGQLAIVEREAELTADEPCILVRPEASPEDVGLFRRAKGVLTTSGGLTSHAAVIARGMGLPAIVGASAVRIDATARCLRREAGAELIARHGDQVTLDGQRGLLYAGHLELLSAVTSPELLALLSLLAPIRRRRLYARGEASAALRAAREVRLDGVVVRGTLQGLEEAQVSGPVFVETTAAALNEALQELPQGVGVLLPLEAPEATALLASVRGRPRGVRLSGSVRPPPYEVELALLANGYPWRGEVQARDVLWEAAEGVADAPPLDDGICCVPAWAVPWALWLAQNCTQAHDSSPHTNTRT